MQNQEPIVQSNILPTADDVLNKYLSFVDINAYSPAFLDASDHVLFAFTGLLGTTMLLTQPMSPRKETFSQAMRHSLCAQSLARRLMGASASPC